MPSGTTQSLNSIIEFVAIQVHLVFPIWVSYGDSSRFLTRREPIMASSAGKRQREAQKVDKAQAKAERKAARLASEPEDITLPPGRSESAIIDDMAELHRASKSGEISPEEFSDRLSVLQRQLQQFT